MAGNGNIDFFCLECYTGKSEVNTLQTEVIKLDRENMDLDALKRAGEIIKSGGLVAFPTETVYGLGGDGLHEESSRKIYEAKGRPSDNPLIVHVATSGKNREKSAKGSLQAGRSILAGTYDYDP